MAGRGEAARCSGAWAQAEAAHEAALALAEVTLGPDADGTARIAHNLAVIYKYTGRFDQADQLYQRALTVATARHDDAFAATICHNLGGLAHARGAYAEGVPWARRSVALRVASDADPVTVAADCGALAAGRARPARRGSFAAHPGAGIPSPSSSAPSTTWSGSSRATSPPCGWPAVTWPPRSARATGAEDQAACARNNPSGTGAHPHHAGTIRRKRGDHAQARDLHQQALALLEPAVDATHPLLKTIRDNLSVAQLTSTRKNQHHGHRSGGHRTRPLNVNKVDRAYARGASDA